MSLHPTGVPKTVSATGPTIPFQSPPCPLKVPIPDSALIPAPVKAATFPAAARILALEWMREARSSEMVNLDAIFERKNEKNEKEKRKRVFGLFVCLFVCCLFVRFVCC